MLYKGRTESNELQILKSLNARMTLADKDKQYYHNLLKGFEGEVLFDTFTAKLECNCYILNDLLFKLNNTQFQLDSIIITAEAVYLFEIKNFEGDYIYESERFYSKSRTEITSPLIQLSRSESLLRQLLQNFGTKLPLRHLSFLLIPSSPYIKHHSTNR